MEKIRFEVKAREDAEIVLKDSWPNFEGIQSYESAGPRRDSQQCVLCYRDDELVGYGLFKDSDIHIHILYIQVLDTLMRYGIGNGVMNWFLENFTGKEISAHPSSFWIEDWLKNLGFVEVWKGKSYTRQEREHKLAEERCPPAPIFIKYPSTSLDRTR